MRDAGDDYGYAARTRRDPIGEATVKLYAGPPKRNHHSRAEQVDSAVRAAYAKYAGGKRYATMWMQRDLCAGKPFGGIPALVREAWRSQHA